MKILKWEGGRFSQIDHLFREYSAKACIFFLLFIINFSTLKFSIGSGSNGNVEQWINLTNQMFYGNQDLLFSYGPLFWITGGVATIYNTFSYWLAVSFISAITAFFWSILFTLSIKSNSLIYFAIAYFLFFISLLLPATLYLWPIAVLAYLEFSNEAPIHPGGRSVVFIGVLVGLSFYIRFFYGVVALTAFGSYFFCRFLSARNFIDVALFTLGLVASYIIFGLIIFHDKSSLIDYLIVNSQLSFGNSVDMTMGVTNSVLSFVAVAIIFTLLNIFFLLKRRSLLLTVDLLLLIFFKLGFSRTDHYIKDFVVPTAALALLLVFKRGLLGRVLFFGVMASLYYLSTVPSYVGAVTENSLATKTDFHESYVRRMKTIYPTFRLSDGILKTIGASSIDIYPYNNEYAFANDLNYRHRPIFQNYMTLTPVLDKMNQHYFESKGRPKFILWTSGIECVNSNCDPFDAFDNKFSLNQDPLTTSAMLLNYHSVDVFGAKDGSPALLLEANATSTRYSESVVSTNAMKFGQWYKVPDMGSGVIKLVPSLKFTLLGRLKNLLFRGDVLNIKYKLDSGEIRGYRASVLNADSGIWITPLLNSFKLTGPVVSSIMLETSSNSYFDPTFQAKWINVPIYLVNSKQSTFDQIQTPPKFTKKIVLPCDGFIDTINGAAPQSKVASTDVLRVKGWFAISSKNGTTADKTFVTLTDQHGATQYFSTQSHDRPDVAAAFNQSGLSSSGYESLIDLKKFSGSYRLGLAGTRGNELYICSQYSVSVTAGD